MAVLATKSVVVRAAAARPAAARTRVPVPRTVGAPARGVAARASSSEDPSVKLQQQFNEAVDFVKTKWDETEDAEKPAAVAIVISAVVAQIVIGATVDAVDHLPVIHQFLELVGLAVTGVYGYRYVTSPEERDVVKKNIESFVVAVTGKKL